MGRPRKQRNVEPAPKIGLTAERLRHLFIYDPETGRFTRRVGAGGELAGTSPAHIDDHGYNRFSVDGVLYRAHRLAWLYVYGAFPTRHLDHIDGDRAANRIANLRECDDALNSQNASALARSDNLSGHRGVTFHPKTGKWQARITVHGRTRSCGLFTTPEDARAAYFKAKAELHPFQSWERHSAT